MGEQWTPSLLSHTQLLLIQAAVVAGWVLVVGVGWADGRGSHYSAPPPFPHPAPSPPNASLPFIIKALFVHPSPFAHLPTKHTSRKMTDGKINSGSEKNLNKAANEEALVVKVFDEDWDDLETCPYWCKKEDGSMFCCPEENEHAGSCPKLRRVVCERKEKDYHYCSTDATCQESHKCCLSRCARARVCTLAIITEAEERREV